MATLPALQASLILWISTWIASVVLRPGRLPNCPGGSMACFLAKKERSVATRVEKSLPMVSSSPMGR